MVELSSLAQEPSLNLILSVGKQWKLHSAQLGHYFTKEILCLWLMLTSRHAGTKENAHGT